MKLKVLSYNVHKLFNTLRTQYFLSALKELLSTMDLDLVFLQEIRGLQPSKYKDDYDNDPLEHLADDLWEHFIYGKNAISTGGHHGNAILSKYPFLSSENFNISNHSLEKRGLLVGKINIPEYPIHVCCTHLDLTLMGRRKQTKKIQAIIEKNINAQEPLLMCGDFNDWSGKISKQVSEFGLKETAGHFAGSDPATFPSIYPVLSLDKMFYRNLECGHVRVLDDPHWKKLSDHLPLYGEFEIKK